MIIKKANRVESSVNGEDFYFHGEDENGQRVYIVLPVNVAAEMTELFRMKFTEAGNRRMAIRDGVKSVVLPKVAA